MFGSIFVFENIKDLFSFETEKKTPPADAEKWKDVPNKYEKFFSEKPGK